MRASQLFFPTLKEVPAEAELISHQLMLRAGMVRKLASGLYTWLPLGWRVLHKVAQVVREEMDYSGAQEILMPCIQPAELWRETERWDKFGEQLLKIQDRHQRDFCFGPTHEEVVTDLTRRELRSYKQLPLNLYQIQLKFRDEIRPRFGVMRAREFMMKDAYSFHVTETCLQQTYQCMYETYQRIFTRLGLRFYAVLADTGAIGGSVSHEFQVLAEAGEDRIVYSDRSDYAANIELAEAVALPAPKPASGQPKQIVDTPTQRTIADVSKLLQLPSDHFVKVLLVKGVDTPIVGLVLRGDHSLNVVKAEKLPQVKNPLTFADPQTVEEVLGCPVGFIGPVELPIPFVVDQSAARLTDFVCGANQIGKHYINVNWDRDVAIPEVADLREVAVGDPSPDGQGFLQMARGIEVGHIFQLGQKYSQAMGLTILNEEGRKVYPYMGCYGIGISRIVAAAIEQNHDEYGIIWPVNMAPFQVVLISVQAHKSAQVREWGENLYARLRELKIDVLYDDRPERPGVKFAEMDLIGIPHRLVVSEQTLKQGKVEYKHRQTQESQLIELESVIRFLQHTISM